MRTVQNTVILAVLGIAGILFYFLVGVLYFGAGLVMPYPWVFGMWALWLAGLIGLIRVFRTTPVWTPLVPLAAVILWVAIVQLGSWMFGWTA